MTRGAITLAEIHSQPRLWALALQQFDPQAGALQRFWSAGGFDHLLLTGCGSTYYLSMVGAALLQAALRVPAQACSAAELLLFPAAYHAAQRKTLLIAVSRSGTTRETVTAAQQFRQQGRGSLLVITCDSQSPLAQIADVVLALDAAQEQSRVQTRSFSSMGLLLTALAAAWGGRDWQLLAALPAALERLLPAAEAALHSFSQDTHISQFAFLGSGALYGIACEAMLKLTEMARVPSVSFHILEYLHGARYAADAQTAIISLISAHAQAEEYRALKTLRHGRQVILVDARPDDADPAALWLALAAGVPEWGRALLYLPPLQLLGWQQAIVRGFDPDHLPFDPRFPNTP